MFFVARCVRAWARAHCTGAFPEVTSHPIDGHEGYYALGARHSRPAPGCEPAPTWARAGDWTVQTAHPTV